MTGIQLLKRELRYSGLTYQKVAELLGVGRSTFSRKLLNGGRALTLREVHALILIMKLSKEEVWQIFFSGGVLTKEKARSGGNRSERQERLTNTV
nr:MAG TPA: Regulatory protein-modification, helix-turn-helix, transcriptional regulato, DNA [Caudoviricetes sp.]